MSKWQFCGADAADLAKRYGTPLYVVSEDIIRSNIAAFKRAFDDRYPRCSTHYAGKAFLTKDMVRIVKSEGIGLDAVSGGELALARGEDLPPERVAFHGNSKTNDEIAAAIEWGVGAFVCDSLSEIEEVSAIARERGKVATILLRLNPMTASATHAHIATSGARSKFGVPASDVRDAVELCRAREGARLDGFHFHVGSQLMDATSHKAGLASVLEIISSVRESTGYVPHTLDLGGGFGVAYTDDDHPAPIEDFLDPMVAMIDRVFEDLGEERPHLIIEPGRRVVADAGITLYSVCSVKRVGEVVFVGVDGGYPDNPRPEMYGAIYRAIAVDAPDDAPKFRTSLVGKCCESGDVVIENIMLPELKRGDVIAVMTTGAYCFAMSNWYNMTPRPALVMLKKKEERLSVARQTLDELFENMI